MNTQELANLLINQHDDRYKTWFEKLPANVSNRISKKQSQLKHGLSVISTLQCNGPKACPFFHSCPIPENPAKPGPDKDYPLGMPCVVEAEFMTQRIIDYTETLKANPKDPIEMSLINELALLDLFKNRAVLILAGGDRLGQGRDLMSVDETIAGWDDNGNPKIVTSSRIHPAVEILDKHEKRRTKILDKFMATREAKFNAWGGNQENISKLQQDMEKVRAHLESTSKGLKLNTDQEQPVLMEIV